MLSCSPGWEFPRSYLNLAPACKAEGETKVTGLTSKEIYLRALSWLAARGVVSYNRLPNLESLYRGLHWGQSCIQSRYPHHHISVSRLYPYISLWEQGRQAECIFQSSGEGGRKEFLTAQGLTCGSNHGQHLLDDVPQYC